MKICVIPDIHGRTVWRDIITTDNYDKIVFLGDFLEKNQLTLTDLSNKLGDLIDFNNPELTTFVIFFTALSSCVTILFWIEFGEFSFNSASTT